MKFKLFIALMAVSLFAASCKDKKSAEELDKLKKQMTTSDSICQADKQSLMDSIMVLNSRLDSLMMPNMTGTHTSKTTTTTTTTKTSTDNGGKIDVNTKNGANTQVDVNKKEGANTKIDVNKKSGAVKTNTGK